MTTREKILQAVLSNQPPAAALPDLSMFKGQENDLAQKYMDVFNSIGGNCFLVEDFSSIKNWVLENVDNTKRIVTTLPELSDKFEMISVDASPHSYENIELAIVKGHSSVAENGAVWFTDEIMGQRIIPYICQHLAVVVAAESIVPTLHEAYEAIGKGDYGYGAFISGPSKTADIEQALVLGAHGPLSMTVFITK